MQAKLKFYAILTIISFLSLIYLIFFFYYDWSVSDYQTLNEAFKAVNSRNPRWITWGICTSGASLIAGFILATGLLFAPSDEEFFQHFMNDFLKMSKQKAFPITVRGLGLFVVVVIMTMLIVSQGGWRLGLRNGFEVIGVFVWVVFLMATLIAIPTLLVNVFHKELQNLLIKVLAKKDNDG